MTALTTQARRRLSRWSAAAIGTTLLAAALPGLTPAATAAPGDLDPAFAGGGRASLGNGFRVVALDQFADGRFSTVSVRPQDTDALDVRRFSPTGVPDASFGGAGVVQVGGQATWVAPAVALDSATGFTYLSAFNQAAGFSRVWRFTGGGTLDPAWGGIGRVDFPGARFLDVALQPDGRLVVANGSSVYRLGGNGAVDTTFGNGGGVTLGTGQVDSLEVLPDGTVMAGGRSATSIDAFRLGRDGALDNRFGTNGTASYRPTPPLGWTIAGIDQVSVGVLNDGGVVVSSGAVEQNTTNGNQRSPLIVTAFTRGGGTDRAFTTTRSYDVSSSGTLAVQADDKVVVPITYLGRAALWRLDADGDLDPTFASGGGWTDGASDSRTTAALVQTAGRIVVTGFASGQTGLVWAFQGDPTPRCQGRYATAYGGTTSDRLYGTDGPDVIVGGRGKDVVVAGAGADRICGDEGKDKLVGGNGRDRIVGGADADVLLGFGGKDKLTGGGGNDRILGNGGKDRLYGGSGDDRLYGGSGKDTLRGGSGRNLLRQ
ncbi:MAG: hypothetical protein ABIQ15_03485 [Nocardioides sp.]